MRHVVMPKTPKTRDSETHFATRLKKVYYNPKHPASFGGIKAIEKAVNEDKSKKKVPIKYIQHWLSQQTTYTLLNYKMKIIRVQVDLVISV